MTDRPAPLSEGSATNPATGAGFARLSTAGLKFHLHSLFRRRIMQDKPSRPSQEIASQLSQEKIGERVLELCEELTQALEQEQEKLCAATDKDPSIT